MKILLFKRSLAYAVVILFIGLSVTSSIHAYSGKIDNQSVEEDISNLNLNDDYVNGFWKFNEGGGDTAYDSSDRGYDGTINGASWVSGYSGYGLDFDGTNDYVSLDSYAKDYLGYNKTDDLVYSLYFKTTQNTKGVMYSVSAPEYNPGTHVALNANGTIEFRAWRLSCGITLTSEGVYNDGDWHYLEIWYNGMPANPVVKMYVDDEFDNSIEYYVCQFNADLFTKAKIGTRSNDTENHFDGTLDNVKIIKYPGGNEQNPPTISGPDSGEPEAEYDFSFTTYDPEGDEILLYVDWDDGTNTGWIGPYDSGEEVILSHTWDLDNRYEIRAESKDIWHHSAPSKHVVKIGNQPPVPPIIDGQRYGDTQQQITYSFVASDEENENIKYLIDWDDGTTDESNYVPSETPVQMSHSWETKDDYYITATAFDSHGKPSDPSIYHIRIGDQKPDMPSIYGAVRGTPDIFYEYGFLSIDPENDNLTYEIDWGDGYLETDIGPYPSGEIFPRSHKWNNTGNYLIKARAKDEFEYYSDWSEYEINVPWIKANNFNLLELLFERFPFAFSIFEGILKLLKFDGLLFEDL